MAISLQQLDQRRVAVEIAIGDELRVLRGGAIFCNDPTLGDCLRITIDDPAAGQMEILLRQSEWGGLIARDDRHDCDFRLRLDSFCLSD